MWTFSKVRTMHLLDMGEEERSGDKNIFKAIKMLIKMIAAPAFCMEFHRKR